MGHIMPMTGISNAFEKKYGDKCEVIKSFVFSESKREEVNKLGKTVCDCCKIVGNNRLYNRFEHFSYHVPSALTLKALDLYMRKGGKGFTEDLAEINPDLTVSTFYLPSHLARLANARKKTDTLIATYSPDPYIYPAWDRRCDLFFVNNAQAEKMAVKRGFKRQTVKRIPFVCKSDMTGYPMTKRQARESVGIKDLFTVLFSFGAYGTNKVHAIIKELLKLHHPINIVAVCGKNQEIFAKLSSLTEYRDPLIEYTVIGFTDRMSEYMRASDLVVGKAGSNTIMECALFGVPLIIADESSILEELTAKYAVKENIAIREKRPQKVAELAEKFITGGISLSQKEKNEDDLRGAELAADELFRLLKTRFPEL